MAMFVGLRLNQMALQSGECPLPFRQVSPIVSGECSIVVLPPALTSCMRIAPSAPVNSTMTRHLIQLS
jgi:hypothetical protein